LSDEELTERALPFLVAAVAARGAAGEAVRVPTADDLRPLMPIVRERMPTLAGVGDMLDFLFVDDLRVDAAAVVPKKWDRATTLTALTAAREVIADVGKVSFEADELEAPLRRLAEERGWKVGDLFMSIRVAVTGKTATPPLFDTLVALGYERTLARLDKARDALEAASAG
jgi:glutamyl-tRNA synthetase